MYPNQDSINGSSAALKIGAGGHLTEPFRYIMLNAVINRIRNSEIRMPADSINHVPTTVDGIRVTDAIRTHYVI
jgi:hypothetical protein